MKKDRIIASLLREPDEPMFRDYTDNSREAAAEYIETLHKDRWVLFWCCVVLAVLLGWFIVP